MKPILTKFSESPYRTNYERKEKESALLTFILLAIVCLGFVSLGVQINRTFRGPPLQPLTPQHPSLSTSFNKKEIPCSISTH